MVPSLVKCLPGSLIYFLCHICCRRKRELPAMMAEFAVNDLDLDDTDIGFVVADPCADRFAEREQDVVGAVRVCNIIRECD